MKIRYVVPQEVDRAVWGMCAFNLHENQQEHFLVLLYVYLYNYNTANLKMICMHVYVCCI